MTDSIVKKEFVNMSMINELIDNVTTLKIHYTNQQNLERAKTAIELENKLIEEVDNLNSLVTFAQTWIKLCKNQNSD